MSAQARRRVLVTGARGQVGTELQKSCPADVELVAVDHGQLDIGDRAAVLDAVTRLRPDTIINAAAYTAVDRAETEHVLAFRVNGEGAGYLAEAAARSRARLIQISTDYVFDGIHSTPYKPDDEPNPINVYGASKLAGERAAADRTEGRALIVRTSWVYSTTGKNFVKTVLHLLQEKPEVRVISDQIGAPTHAEGLARALWRFTAHPEALGVFHWSDAGTTTWYDLALAIRSYAKIMGVDTAWARVVPISSAEYPSLARRPAYGVLDFTGSERFAGSPQGWSIPLESIVARLWGTQTAAR